MAIVGRRPREDRGRDESAVAGSNKPRKARSPQKPEVRGGPSPGDFGGSTALLTLHFGLLVPRTKRIN